MQTLCGNIVSVFKDNLSSNTVVTWIDERGHKVYSVVDLNSFSPELVHLVKKLANACPEDPERADLRAVPDMPVDIGYLLNRLLAFTRWVLNNTIEGTLGYLGNFSLGCSPDEIYGKIGSRIRDFRTSAFGSDYMLLDLDGVVYWSARQALYCLDTKKIFILKPTVRYREIDPNIEGNGRCATITLRGEEQSSKYQICSNNSSICYCSRLLK